MGEKRTSGTKVRKNKCTSVVFGEYGGLPKCLKCNKELFMGDNGEVADAWISMVGFGKLEKIGYVCNNCFFKDSSPVGQ